MGRNDRGTLGGCFIFCGSGCFGFIWCLGDGLAGVGGRALLGGFAFGARAGGEGDLAVEPPIILGHTGGGSGKSIEAVSPGPPGVGG